MKFLFWQDPKRKWLWLGANLLLVSAIGITDYQTGYELAFSPFYLFPVFAASWISGNFLGLMIACASALTWMAADVATGHVYTHPAYIYANTGLRLVNFIVVAYLATRLKYELNLQNQLARKDPVTGLANSRAFLEALKDEAARAARYHTPLTVVYIDLDNFKLVNDHRGHLAGDQALQDVARAIQAYLRRIDLAARLGGDEFALLLPETGQDAARASVTRLHAHLTAEMAKQHLPITFSMGAVIAEKEADVIPENLLRQADDQMYLVKKSGKNNVCFSTYSGAPTSMQLSG